MDLVAQRNLGRALQRVPGKPHRKRAAQSVDRRALRFEQRDLMFGHLDKQRAPRRPANVLQKGPQQLRTLRGRAVHAAEGNPMVALFAIADEAVRARRVELAVGG